MAAAADAEALGKGRTGMDCVAASMKVLQVAAGSVPPTTPFIGPLLSLPNHTPATRSAV